MVHVPPMNYWWTELWGQFQVFLDRLSNTTFSKLHRFVSSTFCDWSFDEHVYWQWKERLPIIMKSFCEWGVILGESWWKVLSHKCIGYEYEINLLFLCNINWPDSNICCTDVWAKIWKQICFSICKIAIHQQTCCLMINSTKSYWYWNKMFMLYYTETDVYTTFVCDAQLYV